MDFLWLWDERRDSRIGLLPRNGDVSRIQWFEAPLCHTTVRTGPYTAVREVTLRVRDQ